MRSAPGFIIALISIHCFPLAESQPWNNHSRSSESWIAEMLSANLIELSGEGIRDVKLCNYRTTARGKALIDKWCNTELPVLVETWT